MQPNYVLENNRTAATHFIETFRWIGLSVHSVSPKPVDINWLNHALDVTAEMGGKTIAIFKIHPKCKN